MTFGNSTADSVVALTYSESNLFARPYYSDDSIASWENTSWDGALRLTPPEGYWEQPRERLRGGFRYLTIATEGDDSSVTISNVSVYLNFYPDSEDLQAYSGYFFAKDAGYADDEDFLTKRE